jgi:hypothetical protein
MSNRIPTTNGPDSSDPAYRDRRYRPVITDKGLTVGDTVQSPQTGDTWRIEGISKDRATVRHLETNTVERVYDSWFSGVKPVEN